MDQHLVSLLNLEIKASEDKQATRERRQPVEEPTAVKLRKQGTPEDIRELAPSQQSAVAKESAKKLRKPKQPPFDFFGITPLFYMLGEKKTAT